MSELRLAGNYVDYTWPLGGDGGAESAFARMRRPRTILASALLASAMLAAAVGALSVAGAAPAAAQEPEAEQCLDPQVCPIPYVRLAKQETEPFLRFGNVVDKDHPRYGDYKRALRGFPDVRSCLIEVEREKPRPDLRQIDWDAMRDIIDIDVCVFRIASSIEDVENIKYWLIYNDFSVDAVLPHSIEDDTLLGQFNKIHIIDSSLSIEKFRMIIPRMWLTKFIGLEVGRSYELIITFTREGKVKDVGSILRSIMDE